MDEIAAGLVSSLEVIAFLSSYRAEGGQRRSALPPAMATQ
jgi:hypothetical protein